MTDNQIDRVEQAKLKFERGEWLTEEEVKLLPLKFQLAYAEDVAEEAEHQKQMDY